MLTSLSLCLSLCLRLNLPGRSTSESTLCTQKCMHYAQRLCYLWIPCSLCFLSVLSSIRVFREGVGVSFHRTLECTAAATLHEFCAHTLCFTLLSLVSFNRVLSSAKRSLTMRPRRQRWRDPQAHCLCTYSQITLGERSDGDHLPATLAEAPACSAQPCTFNTLASLCRVSRSRFPLYPYKRPKLHSELMLLYPSTLDPRLRSNLPAHRTTMMLGDYRLLPPTLLWDRILDSGVFPEM